MNLSIVCLRNSSRSKSTVILNKLMQVVLIAHECAFAVVSSY